jgi:hypothetical protein
VLLLDEPILLMDVPFHLGRAVDPFSIRVGDVELACGSKARFAPLRLHLLLLPGLLKCFKNPFIIVYLLLC